MAKFTFDATTHSILINTGVRNFTGTELFSEAASWADKSENMSQFDPMDSTGKFSLGGGISSDIIFRVLEPWKIKPENGDYILNISGTVISDTSLEGDYNSQTTAFTVGEFVEGQTSGATGLIISDSTPSIGDGNLTIARVKGTFTPGETIVDELGGTATIGTTIISEGSPTKAPDSGNVTIKITAASSGTVAFSEQINQQSFVGSVLIDVTDGTAGTAFPKGTPSDAVNNLADAISIANTNGLRVFTLRGEITLTQAFTRWKFEAVSPLSNAIINLAGQNVNNSIFTGITIKGIQNGVADFRDCVINGVSNLVGNYIGCTYLGTLTVSPLTISTPFSMTGAQSAGFSSVVIDFENVAGKIVAGTSMTGPWKVINMNNAIPFPSICVAGFVGGEIELDATCILGSLTLEGNGNLVDNSQVSFAVDTSRVLNSTTIPSAVWGYVIEGSASITSYIRIMASVLFGKSSGGGTTNIKYRDVADTKDRIDATVTVAEGNRTGVTTDGS